MSSRALRKAQALREKQELELKAHDEDAGDDEDEEDVPAFTAAKPSIFSMLGDASESADVEDDKAEEEDEETLTAQPKFVLPSPQYLGLRAEDDSSQQPGSASKKKKKKKKKAKTKSTNGQPVDDGLDDIDIALQGLRTSSGNSGNPSTQMKDASTFLTSNEVSNALRVDSHNLQVVTEMRRLFGRAAFDADKQEAQDRRAAMLARARHSAGREVHLNLNDMVSGAYAAGGPGLSKLIRDRNLFIKGKEEWPRVSASGLGMEIVQRLPNGVIEYKFTHNSDYQSVQRNFEGMASMMDPQILISSLRFHPYHITTLLQVSEIAKHEKDYSTCGDLLERALFSFGKALHPSFAESMAAGKARLDFRRPENREFWLAGWRYITNIGMRATWRTAYEWAKFLLSLDPEGDPYAMRVVIDQLAIRARESDNLLEILASPLSASWSDQPNVQFSRALALKRKNRDEEAQQTLTDAIIRFPWLAARLCGDLGVSRIPPSIWGKEAPSDWQELHAELYATSASDLWKLPESTSFFTNVITSLPNPLPDPTSPPSLTRTVEADISLIRHVLFTEKATLYKYLPRAIFESPQSQTDPYPPPQDEQLLSYEGMMPQDSSGLFESTSAISRVDPVHLRDNSPTRFVEELGLLQRFFQALVPAFADAHRTAREQEDRQSARQATVEDAGDEDADADSDQLARGHGPVLPELGDQEVDAALARSRLPVPTIRARLQRLVHLQVALVQGGGRVASDDGQYAVSITGEGPMRVVVDGVEWEPLTGEGAVELAHEAYAVFVERSEAEMELDELVSRSMPGTFGEDVD